MHPTDNTSRQSRTRNSHHVNGSTTAYKKPPPNRVNKTAKHTIDNSATSSSPSQKQPRVRVTTPLKKSDTKVNSTNSAAETVMKMANAQEEREAASTTSQASLACNPYSVRPTSAKEKYPVKLSFKCQTLIQIAEGLQLFRRFDNKQKVEVLQDIWSIVNKMQKHEGVVGASYVLQVLKECPKELSEVVMNLLIILFAKEFISREVFKRQALLVLDSLSNSQEVHIYQICRVIYALKGCEIKNDPLFLSIMKKMIDFEMGSATQLHRLTTLFNCLESLSLLKSDGTEQNILLAAFANIPAKLIETSVETALPIITLALKQETSPEEEEKLLEKARLCVELSHELDNTFEEPVNVKQLLFSIWDEIGGDDSSVNPLYSFPLFELAITLSRKKTHCGHTSPFNFVFGKNTTPLLEKYVLRANLLRSKILLENLDRETRLELFKQLLKRSTESNCLPDTQILLAIYWELEGHLPNASFPKEILHSLIPMAANLPESLCETSEKLLIPAVLSAGLSAAIRENEDLLLPLLQTLARWPLVKRCENEAMELIASLAKEHSCLVQKNTPVCDLFSKVLQNMPYEALERVGAALIRRHDSEVMISRQGADFITETMLAALKDDRNPDRVEQFLRFIKEADLFFDYIDRIPIDWLTSVGVAGIAEQLTLHLLRRSEPSEMSETMALVFVRAMEHMKDPLSEEVLESMLGVGFTPLFLQQDAEKTRKHKVRLCIFSKIVSTLSKPEIAEETKLKIGRPLAAKMAEYLEAEGKEKAEKRVTIDCKMGIIPLVRFAERLECPESKALAFKIMVLSFDLRVAGREFGANFDKTASSWDIVKNHREARQIFLDSVALLVTMKENKPDVSTLSRELMKDAEQEDFVESAHLLSLYQDSQEAGRSAEIPKSMVPALIAKAAELSVYNPESAMSLLLSASRTPQFHAVLKETPALITFLLKTISGWPQGKEVQGKVCQIIISLAKEQTALYEQESSCHILFMQILRNLPQEEILEIGSACVALRHTQSVAIQRGIEAAASALFESLSIESNLQQKGKFIKLLHDGQILTSWLEKIPFRWFARVQVPNAAEEITLFLFKQKAPTEKKDEQDLHEAYSNCLKQVSSFTEESFNALHLLNFCPVFRKGIGNAQESIKCKVELLSKIILALNHHAVTREDRKRKGRLVMQEMATALEEYVQNGNRQLPKIVFEKEINPLFTLSNRLIDPLCSAYAFKILACCYRLTIAPQWDVRKLESYYESAIAQWKKISVDAEARPLFIKAVPILTADPNIKVKILPLSKILVQEGKQDAVEAGLSLLEIEIMRGLASRNDISRELKRSAQELIDKAIENLSEGCLATLFSLLRLENIGLVLTPSGLDRQRSALVHQSLKLFQLINPQDKLRAIQTLKGCQEWLELHDPALFDLVNCLSKLALSLYRETGNEEQFSQCEQVVMSIAKLPLFKMNRVYQVQALLALSLELYKVYLTRLINATSTLENPAYLQGILRVHLEKFFHEKIPLKEASYLIREMIKCQAPVDQKARDTHFSLICYGLEQAHEYHLLEGGGISFAKSLRAMYPQAKSSRPALVEALINIVLESLNHHTHDMKMFNVLFDFLFTFPPEEKEAVSEVLQNFPRELASSFGTNMIFITKDKLQKMMIIALAMQQPIALVSGDPNEDPEKKVLEALEWLLTLYCAQDTPAFAEQAVITLLWTYDLYLRDNVLSVLPLFRMVLQAAKKFPMKTVQEIISKRDEIVEFTFLDTIIHTGKLWKQIYQSRGHIPREDYPLFELLISAMAEELMRNKSDNSATLIQIHTSLLMEAGFESKMFSGSEGKLLTTLEPLITAYFECLASSTTIKVHNAILNLCVTLLKNLPGKKEAMLVLIRKIAAAATLKYSDITDFSTFVHSLIELLEEHD